MQILLMHDWEIVQKALGNDVSTLSSISGALAFAKTEKYDVALVDVERYGAAVRGLSQYLPVIGLAISSSSPQSNRALLNGALIVLPLDCELGKLRETVKKAKEGSLEKTKGKEMVFLFPRQQEVLNAIVEGLNAPQIARKLRNPPLNVGYVRNVIRVLYEKAGVDGCAKHAKRSMLVKWAMENGYGGEA